MSWTRGNSSSNNQSPFIEPTHQTQNQQPNPNQRRDYETRTASSTKESYNSRQQPQIKEHRNDTAATFTKDGLQAFAHIFSSSVESAVGNLLPKIVERVIEEKLQGIVRETISEISESVANRIAHARTDIQTSIQQQFSTLLDEREKLHTPKIQYKQNVKQQKTTTRRIDMEVKSILQALKNAGGTMTAQELRGIQEVHWGKNSTVKMNHIMRNANGRIQRIGKGLYQINGPV